MPSSIASAETILCYLDDLLTESQSSQSTDWNQLLDEAVASHQTDTPTMVPGNTTLKPGMALVRVSLPGAESLGLQFLDAALLANRLPSGSRMQYQAATLCHQLAQSLGLEPQRESDSLSRFEQASRAESRQPVAVE
jgi:hypothetical protein